MIIERSIKKPAKRFDLNGEFRYNTVCKYLAMGLDGGHLKIVVLKMSFFLRTKDSCEVAESSIATDLETII